MFEAGKIENISRKKADWEEKVVKLWLEKLPERRKEFKTSSNFDLKRLYTPTDIEGFEYLEDLGFPGEYPFTRGLHATMYRGRFWTMRQFSGFGTAEETNQRFHYLLAEGETGLSVAFDFPTILGYDSDHPLSQGEVGVCGVAVSSLQDMETLFSGIPLHKVSTSMTINGPASVLLAMYIALGDAQGVLRDQLRGTTQNDMLKEFFAQNLCIFPPNPSVKLVTDIIEYCAKELPQWNPVSISGYHIREAGSTALQELAFTLANGITYVESARERGLEVDDFAPRLSFFFAAHNDLFEEVAKFRAARRIWAKLMKERFNAKKERSMWMRMHVQTSGCALTAQQPINNITRVTLQTLAAVLGGAQSIHTNSFDEALALPSERAVRTALRTQQIVAYESGVADSIDPLGGSYYLENLTNEMEEGFWRYLDTIIEKGGVVKCIENGFFQREIADSSYKYQKEIEEGEKIVVGVNDFKTEDDWIPTKLLRIVQSDMEKQIERVKKLKSSRDKSRVQNTMDKLRKAIEKDENLLPSIVEAVKEYVTVGEICDLFREAYGDYQELIII